MILTSAGLYALTRDNEQNQGDQWLSTLIILIAVALIVLAVIVAYRSTKYGSGALKFWTILLAVLFPELFLIWHGISAASTNTPYFAEGPVAPRAAIGGMY